MAPRDRGSYGRSPRSNGNRRNDRKSEEWCDVASDRTIKIDNVCVLEDTGLVLKCRIAERRIDVPKLMVRGVPPLPGQQGALEVLEWFAVDNGIG